MDKLAIAVSERTVANYIDGFHFLLKRISVVSEVLLSDELFGKKRFFLGIFKTK